MNLPTHLIPVLCKAVNEGETFHIFGDDYATKDGTTSRDFTHVMDIVEGHIKALEYLNEGGTTDVSSILVQVKLTPSWKLLKRLNL